jgi:hypothetical protein
LQQIDSILNDNLPVEQLRGMVRMRQLSCNGRSKQPDALGAGGNPPCSY